MTPTPSGPAPRPPPVSRPTPTGPQDAKQIQAKKLQDAKTDRINVPGWVRDLGDAFQEGEVFKDEETVANEDDFESYSGTTYVDSGGAKPSSGLDESSGEEAEVEAPEDYPPHALVSPLLPNQVLLSFEEATTIGRHPNSTIPLPSSKVSRNHAEIRFDGQSFSIHDLNSTNGTFVNGTRVHRRRRLRSGIRIEIGPFNFEIVQLSSPDQVIDKTKLTDATTETRFDLEVGLAGSLEQTAVADLIQFIESTAKTGQLTFYQKEGQGRVWIDKGTVIHAEYGSEYGLSAALLLFGMTRGRFEFRNAPVTCPRTVTKPTKHLLMEAARMGDEHRASQSGP